jgi:hypothetical protein
MEILSYPDIPESKICLLIESPRLAPSDHGEKTHISAKIVSFDLKPGQKIKVVVGDKVNPNLMLTINGS